MFQHYGRLAGSSRAAIFSLVVSLLGCLLISACVPSGTLQLCDANADNEFSWKGPDFELMNTRVEIPDRPTLNAGTFWLKGCVTGQQCLPDQLTVKWDTYTVFWSLNKDVTCDFATVPENQNNEDCERCNYCISPTGCHVYTLIGDAPGDVGPTVVRHEGFIVDANAAPTEVDSFGPYSGCPNLPTEPPNRFTPTGKATYRVLAPKFASDNESCENRKTIAEKKVVVLSDTTDNASYPVEIYRDPPRPGYVWYKGARGVNSFWDDNFSSGLRIAKVRVLKGKRSMDPQTGRYALTDYTPVRPSRVVLVPNYDSSQPLLPNQDTTACYANPSIPDGDIDLTFCRGTFGANGQLLSATPDFLGSEQLTWFIEFNPCEGCGAGCMGPCPTGATAPTLAAGEELAIEFTIAAIP